MGAPGALLEPMAVSAFRLTLFLLAARLQSSMHTPRTALEPPLPPPRRAPGDSRTALRPPPSSWAALLPVRACGSRQLLISAQGLDCGAPPSLAPTLGRQLRLGVVLAGPLHAPRPSNTLLASSCGVGADPRAPSPAPGQLVLAPRGTDAAPAARRTSPFPQAALASRACPSRPPSRSPAPRWPTC